MGTSTNEHTGSRMASKPSTDKYRDGWDNIFGKKQEETDQERYIRASLAMYPVGVSDLFSKNPEEVFPGTKWEMLYRHEDTEHAVYLRKE